MQQHSGRLVVVTDLDGTLLDASDYSFEPALPALEALRERSIPLVLSSSKTRAELEYYAGVLRTRAPLVSENGGGIFLPATAEWKAAIDGTPALPGPVTEEGAYFTIRLGPPYEELRRALRLLRARGFEIRGFGEMSVEEVAALTGLPPDQAAWAKQREFDECFLLVNDARDPEQEERLAGAVRELGLRLTRGRFHHLLGRQDKGRALEILRRLFATRAGGLSHLIALGDSLNDLPMLQAADTAVVMPQPGGAPRPELIAALGERPALRIAPHPGPEGWCEALLRLLGERPASRPGG